MIWRKGSKITLKPSNGRIITSKILASLGEMENTGWGNDRLRRLAEELRSYKPSKDSSFSQEGPSHYNLSCDLASRSCHASAASSQLAVPESKAISCASNSDIDSVRKRARRAAVLVCLFEGPDGRLRVILTQRSRSLSTHSGEVSLPGGKMEECDNDDAETALREAKEEIGLDPSYVKIVTTMEPFLSKHLLRVVPVVGLLSDINAFKPILNPSEVDAVFDAPLEMFLKNENYRSEEREWMNVKYTVHYFDYYANKRKFLIWGLTASILVRAASIIYQRSPPFPEIVPDYCKIIEASNKP
eukprot:TRINITY_DN8138_c0_g1_i1.p1 TRINITY_DN8138_c0_g1~~TRINITY_DN8138_c0_g1_i1.p1  ORF type:complete len:301 (+),score=63.08 TRINITY_DN8138_c0_g1_i1:71-973(+)